MKKTSSKSERKWNLKHNVYFKEFFSRKENERFLKDFLTCVLKKEIKLLEVIKDYALRKEKLEQKMGILDRKVRLEDGSVVIIEMQIKNNYNIAERMTYYNAKSVATQLKKGAEYIDLKPVTSIVILDYPIYECERYVSTSRIIQEDEIVMVDKMNFKVIELPKIRKRKPNYEDKLYCWLIFIDGKKEEVIEMIKTKYPIFEEAEEELRKIYSESEVEAIMESREKWEWDMSSLKRHIMEEGEKRGIKKGREEGKKEGERKGKKEGIKQGKIETAKAMLGYKFDIKVIANITQIPLEEVKKIKEKMSEKEKSF